MEEKEEGTSSDKKNINEKGRGKMSTKVGTTQILLIYIYMSIQLRKP